MEIFFRKTNANTECILYLQSENSDKQLMDAQSLIESMKLEQFQLVKELESVQTKNQQLMKMLDMKEFVQRKHMDQNKFYKRKQCGSGNPYTVVSVEGNENTSILELQSKLEKLSKDLKEAEILNIQYVEDHATLLSQDHQTESVRNEVEMETTRTIIQLQEEIDRLQSEFQVSLCSMAEQNSILRNSAAAKEDELRVLRAGWERATLELTTFLVNGSRSLVDASREIKSISSSFPNTNDLISEHVEKAAKVCVEKEETILLLRTSLEDAQNSLMEMEQKLYSLKGATIALTEFQQPESSSSREEIQLSRMVNDSTEVKEFPKDKDMSKKSQIDNQGNISILMEYWKSDNSTSTLRDTVDENLLFAHTNAFATTDVDMQIKLASLILAETEDAVNESSAEAETFFSVLSSDIHNVVSFYKELVQDLSKDMLDIRKEIVELKRNQGILHINDTASSPLSLHHEHQLPILQQTRNELVEVNNRFRSMSAHLCKVTNMHCNIDSVEGFTETDGWTSDSSSSCSYSSVESIDNDDKPSSSGRYRCTNKTTEQALDLSSVEGSNLSCKRAVLHFRNDFRKAYETFVKLKNHLMSVSLDKRSCLADVSSFSNSHALKKLKEQGEDGLDQPTSKRGEAGIKKVGEVTEYINFYM